MKRNDRKADELRKVTVTPDYCPDSYGSVFFEMGHTRVICAASLSEDVPDHARKRGTGWITAEYSMLPYSTSPRTPRPLLKRDGRSVEIQRLIARSLRGTADLSLLNNYTIIVDCDVLQADGGTRTASITGGYIALKRAVNRMLSEELISINPLDKSVAAISAGYIGSDLFLDLNYAEDSMADVDMNIVMDSNYKLIEIQGTAEKASFTRDQLNEMVHLGETGIRKLFEIQENY